MSRVMGGVGPAMYDQVIQRMKDMASPAVILSGNKDEDFLFGNVRPHPLLPCRGHVVDRKYGAPDADRVPPALAGSGNRLTRPW